MLKAQTKEEKVCANTFKDYFANAQTFADNYPREKVHLHLDNTGYYVGDTIWFKAYVTEAERNYPSRISTPVYIELVDQFGHTVDRKIIKTENGEGHGQIVFNKSALSGYYEIRAFTKWMLAFGEKQYFSRVIPIYQRQKSPADTTARRIAVYSLLPESIMNLRSEKTKKKLNLRFFPEGGQLVQGISSIVAFEAIDEKNRDVKLSGRLLSKSGEEQTRFETVHNGMGCFAYTPGIDKVKVQVEYQGKAYTFELPKALPAGYVLNVIHRGNVMDIRITRTANTPSDSLAVFISHQGRPFAWYPVDLSKKEFARFRVDTGNMPKGMIQLSLINGAGKTLCDRFCYVMPEQNIQIHSQANVPFYGPYEPIRCELKVSDSNKNPVKAKLSVAVRDALQSDYLEYDNTIYTDLLLTSDLKGYIHQPGYYFVDSSAERQRNLDLLLMVRGWRKYDMDQLISPKPFTPEYMPEKNLVLHGQVKSMIRKRGQKEVMVSVLGRSDSIVIAGETQTDSLGYFGIPVNGFENTVSCVFQTRKVGKKRKKNCSVLLFRNFAPPLRELASFEQHPEWTDISDLQWLIQLNDQVYLDSIIRGSQVIDETIVKAKRPKRNKTIEIEHSIIAFYHIPVMLNKLRDEGKVIYDLSQLLSYLQSGVPDSYGHKDGKPVPFGAVVLYGEILESKKHYSEILLLWENLDMIENVIVCKGPGAYLGVNEHDPLLYKVMEERANMAYIIVKDGYNPKKDYNTRGIRKTDVGGYTRPLEFYSPVYPKGQLVQEIQNRRTLYWNPNVETDENGVATINCYNGDKSTFLTISAETIVDGEPAAITVHSINP